MFWYSSICTLIMSYTNQMKYKRVVNLNAVDNLNSPTLSYTPWFSILKHIIFITWVGNWYLFNFLVETDICSKRIIIYMWDLQFGFQTMVTIHNRDQLSHCSLTNSTKHRCWEASESLSCPRNSSPRSQPGSSLPCSHEPDEFNSYPHHFFFLKWFLPSGFPTEILFAFLPPPMHTSCPTHPTLYLSPFSRAAVVCPSVHV